MNVPQSTSEETVTSVRKAPSDPSPVDPMAELWAAADAWERRRFRVPRAVTIEAEQRLAAIVAALRRRPEATSAGLCSRCGEPVEADRPCKGARRSAP